MNIIIKPQTESQHTTKSHFSAKHYNILLDHMAILTSDMTTNWLIFWGILQKYDLKIRET